MSTSNLKALLTVAGIEYTSDGDKVMFRLEDYCSFSDIVITMTITDEWASFHLYR